DPTGYGGNSITGDYIDPSQTDAPVTTAPPQTNSTTVTTTVSPSQTTATTPPVTSAPSDNSSDNSGNNPGSDTPVKTDYSLLIKISFAVLGVIALITLIFAF
ncbi:transglutaminase domain-containing protein, partial [[Eubacterium] siraeum]|nr:transglutaminase domain-containing protein [[Eubacterium] siraeum]